MALPRVQKVVQDQQGNLVPGVLGSVYNQGTGVLAPLWNDDAGTVVLANPMTNDPQYASFKFYIAPGHYDISFTKPGYTFESIMDFQVVQDLLTLGTMATQNANAVAITGGSVAGLTGLTSGTGYFTGNVTAEAGLVSNTLTVNTSVQLPAGTNITSLAVGGSLGGVGRATVLWTKQTQAGITLRPSDTDTGPGSTVFFQNVAGTGVGSITQTATATAYNTSSDRRLKEAIAALPDALATVLALRPVAFRWRADGTLGHGFLADEVQRVVPEAVTGRPGAVHDDGSLLGQEMDHAKLVVWLTGAIHELARHVETLTAKLATLEGAG